jgi:hypothetical protein
VTKPVLLLCLLLANIAVADALYRYRDSAGIIVTADTIPPNAVIDGYEVVNKQGTVLETVQARQPVDQNQTKQDQYLLASFSHVGEITRLKERKLALLARDIQNLRDSLSSLDVREESLVADAANVEMAGEEVAVELMQQISQARLDRAEVKKLLVSREPDQQSIEALYRGYEQRFRQLELDSRQTSEQ